MTLYHGFVNDLSWVLPLRTEALTQFFTLFPLVLKFAVILTVTLVGYYWINPIFFRNLALVTILSDCGNFFMKWIFKIPRPAIEHLVHVGDHSYSFPSGDVQVATTFWIGMALYFRNIYFTIFSGALVFLVACSRVYNGVHYPKDVVLGFLMGMVYLWFLFKFGKTSIGKRVTANPLVQQGLLWFYVMAMVFFVTQALSVPHVIGKISIASGILLAIAFLKSEPTLYSEPLVATHTKIRLTAIGLVTMVLGLFAMKYWFKYVDEHFVNVYPFAAFITQAMFEFLVFYLVPKFYFTYVRRVVVE
jgi:membrane-associated phospholipid phosphatase